MLASDLGAPRKQRHTAHRIWTRLCVEDPAAKYSPDRVEHAAERALLTGAVSYHSITVSCGTLVNPDA